MLTGQCRWRGWRRESAVWVPNYWSPLPPEPGTAAIGSADWEAEANTGSGQLLESCAPSTWSSQQTGSVETELLSPPPLGEHGAAPPSPTARSLSMLWSSASLASLWTSLRLQPSPDRWTQSSHSRRFSFWHGATCWTCWARRPSAAGRGCTRPDSHGCLAEAGSEATRLWSSPSHPLYYFSPPPPAGRSSEPGTRSCSF